VDYRIQSALLGLTSTSDFVAALGPNPCEAYTDPAEQSSCMALLADSQFMSQLAAVTRDMLTAFQSCAASFALGAPDYQIVLNSPENNGTCLQHTRRRGFAAGGHFDLTRRIVEDMQSYSSAAEAPSLGRRKSSALQLVRKQLENTCSRTGGCFQTCPDCRLQQTYCGTGTTTLTRAVCGAMSVVTNAIVSGLVCKGNPFCSKVAGGWAAIGVTASCEVLRSSLCDPVTQRCSACNAANNGACDAGSTECCAGETGTQCGDDGCCCCPECQAPGGINCECIAAPC